MNGERRRWGLLGGSFDPIHVGHIKLAEAAVTRLDLDRVLLVPAAQAPHKAGAVAAFADRVAMARVAADRERRYGLTPRTERRARDDY